MTANLREEIKQTKPFNSLLQEAELSIVRTANILSADFERALKPHGITNTQFNVLRILRGAGPEGLCRNEVSDRLLTPTPDCTRLLDRMEDAGLVKRERSSEDRRLVTTQLTDQGRSLVDSLDELAERQHERGMGHLTQDELQTLVDLLGRVRSKE